MSCSSSFAAWLRLLRAPNLLTVPGDPLAGYLLAAGAAASLGRPLALAVAISLLLYAGGLLMNDLFDQREDARERPDRPIPAGLIGGATARVVMLTLLAIALLFARYLGGPRLVLTFALLGTVTLYNAVLKRTALGPLAMGACRGLNLLLGASLADVASPLAGVAAAGLALYVAAVTVVARREIAGGIPAWWSALPAAAVLLVVGTLLKVADAQAVQPGRLGTVLFLAFAVAGLGAWRLHAGGPRAAPAAVSLWLSGLLVLQAAFCVASGAGPTGLLAGLVLLLLWPLNRLLAGRVPAS